MPIYEYRCGACGHKLEALQKLSDSPLTECPACGESRLSKLVSVAGFQLKGSGWYATDFRNSGSKPEATKGNEAKANGGEAKSDSKTEAKSDAKSESAASSAASESTSGSTTGGCGSGCSCH